MLFVTRKLPLLSKLFVNTGVQFANGVVMFADVSTTKLVPAGPFEPLKIMFPPETETPPSTGFVLPVTTEIVPALSCVVSQARPGTVELDRRRAAQGDVA